jgi:hypothetical protein
MMSEVQGRKETPKASLVFVESSGRSSQSALIRLGRDRSQGTMVAAPERRLSMAEARRPRSMTNRSLEQE